MSCEDLCCGTGIDGLGNPKPGDPNNNSSLSATSVYGGINVSWSFPTINPHAVAHTVLYRGLNNQFSNAVELARIGGSIYYDQLNPETDTTYYYWIRFLTVNNTFLPQIGPVSAIAHPRGEQTLESLTGLIDAGVLAQELKTSISGITLQGQQLLQEIADRIAANSELSGLLAAVQSGQLDAMTYVQNEISQRTTADSAIVLMVNTMAAAVAQNAAAIFTETSVRVDQYSATASQVTTLFSQYSQNAAAIHNESTTRASADSAMATTISLLTSRVGAAEATIQTETITRASADSAIASRVTTAESTINGNVATGQVGLTTKVTLTDGKVTEIGALYTAKVQVNGLVGGFGVYNDGRLVEAGFDVDRFWVGRTGPDKVKPFIIDNGIVYIDKARIRDADIDTLKIAGNAVTLPISESRTDVLTGLGTARTVMSRAITLRFPGTVQVICTCGQSSDSDNHNWTLALKINTVEVASAGGAVPSDSVALSGSLSLPAGSHTITLVQTSGGGSRVTNRNFTILGAMR